MSETRLLVVNFKFIPSKSINAWSPQQVDEYLKEGFTKRYKLNAPGAFKMTKKCQAILYFKTLDALHDVHFSKDMREVILDYYNRSRKEKLISLRKERFYAFIRAIEYGEIELSLDSKTRKIKIEDNSFL